MSVGGAGEFPDRYRGEGRLLYVQRRGVAERGGERTTEELDWYDSKPFDLMIWLLYWVCKDNKDARSWRSGEIGVEGDSLGGSLEWVNRICSQRELQYATRDHTISNNRPIRC